MRLATYQRPHALQNPKVTRWNSGAEPGKGNVVGLFGVRRKPVVVKPKARFVAAGTLHHQDALLSVAANATWREGCRGQRIADVRVALVADPTNPYDRNAIMITWEGRVLGRIPPVHTAVLLRQFGPDRGAEVCLDGLLLDDTQGSFGLVFPKGGKQRARSTPKRPRRRRPGTRWPRIRKFLS